MTDHLRLQIRAAADGATVELVSSTAQAAAVAPAPLCFPDCIPDDAATLWACLPHLLQVCLADLTRLRPARPLPLLLDIDERLDYLHDWPWELLAPPDGTPFACALRTPLVRAFPPRRPAPPVSAAPLRVLVAAAEPSDHLPVGAGALLERLRALQRPGELAIATLEHCTPVRLEEALREQPDMLVLLAHGEPGRLLLEDATGTTAALSADDLALLLDGTLTRVVVLISCEGASPTDDGRSSAMTLLDRGVLGVIGMRGLIAIPAATTFLAALLAGLARGNPLEVAAAAGRKAIIAAQGQDGGDWMRPVLWQQLVGAGLLPLVLSTQTALARGGEAAAKPGRHWAGKLITGGWIALLATGVLHSLVLPETVAVGALLKLLEGLGLNLLSGYLQPLLERETRHAFGRDEVADMIAQAVEADGAVAAQIAALAETTGALQPTLAAIQRDTAEGRVLLERLNHDINRHPVALEALRSSLASQLATLSDEMKAGMRAIFIQGERVERKVDQLIDLHDAGVQAQTRREQAQLDDYLGWVIKAYQRLGLSRFTDERRGSEERIEELYLQDVYTALTTEVEVVVRGGTRPAGRVVRLQRYFARRTLALRPPEQVRRLFVRLPTVEERSAILADAATAMLEQLDPARPVHFWIRRPELAVEAMAPQAGTAPRLVLLGEPGSGKSTVLRYLAVLLARARQTQAPLELEGWHGQPARLPLLLPLGTLAEALERGDNAEQALWQALVGLVAGPGLNVRPELVAALPRLMGEAMLLLDGLDELSADPGEPAKEGIRQRVAQAIRRLANLFRATPIVVTCRVLPYRTPDPRTGTATWQFHQADGWQERTIQPFAFGQVRRFVTRWYEADARTNQRDLDEAALRAEHLLEELARSRSLREAVMPGAHGAHDDPPASPLLLTMLTILHANAEGRPLPRERDELYEALVTLLLHRWEPKRSMPDYERDDLISRLAIPTLKKVETLRSVIHEVAYDAHCQARSGRDGRGIINADQLRGRLTAFFEEDLGCAEHETLTIAASRLVEPLQRRAVPCGRLAAKQDGSMLLSAAIEYASFSMCFSRRPGCSRRLTAMPMPCPT